MPEDPNLVIETDHVEPVATEPAQPIVEPTVPAIDYEKKFSDSTRENQILLAKLGEQDKAKQELTNEPTDSDLRTAFPEWDLMSDTEKRLATRTLRAERIGGNAAQQVQEINADRSWNTSIELAVASNPTLQGKEQAFRQYASRPQYRNVPMDVLASAFLQTQGLSAAPTPTPHKPGLETGQGGPRETPKPIGLTMEQLAALRKSDPKAYEKYIKTHEITIDE